MTLKALQTTVADATKLALTVRKTRRELANHRRAVEQPAVARFLTEPARRQAITQRRAAALDKLTPDVRATEAAIAAAQADRGRWSTESYMASAALLPVAALPSLPAANTAAGYESAADRRHRIAVERNNELLHRMVALQLARTLKEDIASADVADIAARLQRLDVSHEGGAAELRIIRQEIGRRDATQRAQLAAALDDAVGRVELPAEYAQAAAALAELDLAADVLAANITSIRTGDDAHARNLETARFMIEHKGALVSLADGGRLTDRERYQTSQADEAAADAADVQKLTRAVLQSAASDAADSAAVAQ